MKRIKYVCLTSILLVGGTLVGTQFVASNQINFTLKDEIGDSSILQDIQMDMDLYMRTSISMHMTLNKENIQYDYGNEVFNDSSPLGYTMKQEEVYNLDSPQLIERLEDENGYAMNPEGDIVCVSYQYPQEYANVNLRMGMSVPEDDTYYYEYEGFKTKLLAYSQGAFQLYANSYECKDEDARIEANYQGDVRIDANYPHVEQKIEKANNGLYYTMPTIRPNMEGKAEVIKFNQIKLESNSAYFNTTSYNHTLKPESIYEFDVSRGTYGMMKVYGDNIYLWTYYNGKMKLQKFDTNMNLIDEKETAYELPENSTDIKLYMNDQTLMIDIDKYTILYDVETNMYIDTFVMPALDYLDYYKEDMFYQDGKLFMSVSKNDSGYYYQYMASESDPYILVYEDNDLLYRGYIYLCDYKKTYPLKENVDIDGSSPFLNRSMLKFVRDAS